MKSRRDPVDGLRPIDPDQDIAPVTRLIVDAFGDGLDAAGQLALDEMRRMARRRAWTRWFSWPVVPPGGAVPPGFVWVEGGNVVGNVSMRPAAERGGFLIGNVCVHRDWRRRGIARALMEAALGVLCERRARWVGLEVRADNDGARALYEVLGFQEVGQTVRMIRPAGVPYSGRLQVASVFEWRRARGDDGRALFDLARTTTPAAIQPLLELRREDYETGMARTIDTWLAGKRETWWIAEKDGVLCGAVRALRDRSRLPDRLEVLVSTGYVGALGSALVSRGVVSLQRARANTVEAVLPRDVGCLEVALEEAGFRRSHALVQMRLALASAGSVMVREPSATACVRIG